MRAPIPVLSPVIFTGSAATSIPYLTVLTFCVSDFFTPELKSPQADIKVKENRKINLFIYQK